MEMDNSKVYHVSARIQDRPTGNNLADSLASIARHLARQVGREPIHSIKVEVMGGELPTVQVSFTPGLGVYPVDPTTLPNALLTKAREALIKACAGLNFLHAHPELWDDMPKEGLQAALHAADLIDHYQEISYPPGAEMLEAVGAAIKQQLVLNNGKTMNLVPLVNKVIEAYGGDVNAAVMALDMVTDGVKPSKTK